jgi:predicted MFS family arabinose efflux permease
VAEEGPAVRAAPSALAPLRNPVFRMLWATWMTANICMWMTDVAAAWMMTSLTTSPMWVALVQSAATLPVFLLGLPSGAFADILNRRRYFMATQFWIAVVASALCAVVMSGQLTPVLLLAMCFANGIGLAMRWPVYAAIVPDLVPRTQLPAALALNGVAMNTSRIVGPLAAGAIIASAGSAYVFLLNAALSVAAGLVIMRWKHEQAPSPLGRERLFSAIRVGVQYVRLSDPMKAVLLRIALFFFHSTALLALLPLVARGMQGGAGTFTLLLASLGAGAIVTTLFLPRIRQRMSGETMVLRGTLLQAAAMAVVALAPNAWLAVPAMFVAGTGWIATANSLTVAAQLALPNWVRARGMSIYQMSIMGAGALGAALWGQVATVSSVATSLLVAAASGAVAMMIAHGRLAGRGQQDDLTPAGEFRLPEVAAPPGPGRVEMTIEYCIDPGRATEFCTLMQESRRSRLRQGALAWELLRDSAHSGRYVERIVDESWAEHLRRLSRITTADVALRERKLAFHIGSAAPVVRRFIGESALHS